MSRKRVVIAMSGGVDSSVSAALLQEQWCEVTGVPLRLYDPVPKEPRCRVTMLADDRFEVHFDVPQTSVAPGQAAVIYDGERVLGGGWIE